MVPLTTSKKSTIAFKPRRWQDSSARKTSTKILPADLVWALNKSRLTKGMNKDYVHIEGIIISRYSQEV